MYGWGACGTKIPTAGNKALKLPPFGECGILYPNKFPIPPTVYTGLPPIAHPVIIETITPPGAGTFLAVKPFDSDNDTTNGEEYVGYRDAGTGHLRIAVPFAGNWKIRHDVGSQIVVRILDAYAPGAVEHFGGVRVFGTVASAPVAQPIAYSAPTAASVGVASAVCLAANAARRFLYFRNTDATKTISLSFNGAAVLLSGITLGPGDSIAFNAPGDDIDVGAVEAISSGAATNLAIQEGV